MKKLLVLVSFLAVGLLVGCGETPKAKPATDPAKMMEDMKNATGGMLDEAKKAAEEAGKTVEDAAKDTTEGAKEAVKDATEGAKEAVKEAAGDK